jgi:CRP/FNR family transcriptional regulator, cyclic AMP receptor protein
MEIIELLSQIPFFQELAPADLKNLAKQTELRICIKDEIIFNEGDTDKALFLVKSGEVEIYIPHEDNKKRLILSLLSNGQFFGELSLFDQKPRSATARTVSPSEILILKQETLLDYIQHHPHAAVAMLAVMSERLRQTNEALNKQVSRNVYDEIDEKFTLTDRIADKIASFGGSWKFILSFLGFILLWVIINLGILIFRPFDAYPFQFLNLLLAMVASLQAPFIMLSQNRQSSKDRLSSKIDFEVNLKNEIGIETILKKVDLIEKKFAETEKSNKKRQ